MISVIVPIYNAEKYLEECLLSIINQTYSDLEIILVNDGSSDSSRQICEKYKQTDERIVLINKDNGGLVKARKDGIDKAHGEYITFVDADDWIDRTAYENLVKEKADIIACGLVEEYKNYSITKGNAVGAGYYEKGQIEKHIIPNLLCTDTFFEFGILPNLVCKLIKRDILLNTMNFVSNDVTIGEDVDFFYRTVFEAESICVRSDVPYHYRQHDESMMKKDVPLSKLKSLYSDLRKIKVDERIKREWNTQVNKYILFVTMLKRFDLFYEVIFERCDCKGRMVIYGAGGFGKEVYGRILNHIPSKKIYLVDKKYKELSSGEYSVYEPSTIVGLMPATIFIAVLNQKVCNDIKWELKNKGINDENIITFNNFEVNLINIILRKLYV